MASVLVRRHGKLRLYNKGAAEMVLTRCVAMIDASGASVPMTEVRGTEPDRERRGLRMMLLPCTPICMVFLGAEAVCCLLHMILAVQPLQESMLCLCFAFLSHCLPTHSSSCYSPRHLSMCRCSVQSFWPQ